MNRLHKELERLFGAAAPEGDAAPAKPGDTVRALVLQLAGPTDWPAMSAVWNGVQTDLSLPAPAIAVNGQDGFQLWFSLADPWPAAQGAAFLDGLRRRYLVDVPSERLSLAPGLESSAWLPRPVPALQDDGRLWSAFVAPDLAPLFADEPWLDTAPPPMGQSDLLSRLQSISTVDFQRALAALSPAAGPATSPAPATTGRDGREAHRSYAAADVGGRDPMHFLLDVMNDDGVALSLRIEAAKALLPYWPAPQRP